MRKSNIFKTLSNYGTSEAENYLTEAFVFLLNLLLERKPEVGLEFLNRFCGLTGNQQLTHAESILISTQVVVDDGRPDIQIKQGTDTLIYVEVKLDAGLSLNQLEYYRQKLDEADVPNTELVLLTRSRASTQETTLNTDEYHHVCWYEIHHWFSKFNVNIKDDACNFLITSFTSFLEEKQMSLQQVSWEYIRGVPALVALTDLIEVALLEAMPDTKLKKHPGWSWRGFNFDGFWVGVRFDNPLVVVFENNLGNNPTYKRDFDLNETHFFSLGQSEQLESLVEFFQQSIKDAPSMHT